MLVEGRVIASAGDEFRISLDWAVNVLASGESVTVTEVAASGGTGSVKSDPAPDTTSGVTYFWVEGGTANTSTEYGVTITTSAGRVLHRAITVAYH